MMRRKYHKHTVRRLQETTKAWAAAVGNRLKIKTSGEVKIRFEERLRRRATSLARDSSFIAAAAAVSTHHLRIHFLIMSSGDDVGRGFKVTQVAVASLIILAMAFC